ncbi:MAG: hypothetical protein QOH47_603 [Sphingomonadales bacterium]|jgi:ABC-type Fe3+ transport system permease subunit|nr:hypothetical protein [Sphingomonadales bacterium]
MQAAIFTTLGALFVALVSGLGFLAVRYPATYRTFGMPIFYACIIIEGAISSFGWGVVMGQTGRVTDTFTLWLFVVSLIWGLLAIIVSALAWISQRVSEEKRETDRKDGGGK